MPIQVSFFRDSHDRHGRQVSVEWAQLAARCARHEPGEKDGAALSCGTFNGPRGNANLVSRTLVALDIESNARTGEVPVAADTMADSLAVRGIRSVLWTTHSHSERAPRYRVLLPLAEPIAYDATTDPYLSGAVAAELHCSGVCDQSKYGAASLFYLPRHRAGAPHLARIIEGRTMDNGRIETAALMAAQAIVRNEAEAAALRRANALPDDIRAKIEAYNRNNPIVLCLERYRYNRDSGRWRSRYQHGQGATSVLYNDGVATAWASFSESDAAAGVGPRPNKASSQCACYGDAFSLYVHYEHGNNFRAALAALPE